VKGFLEEEIEVHLMIADQIVSLEVPVVDLVQTVKDLQEAVGLRERDKNSIFPSARLLSNHPWTATTKQAKQKKSQNQKVIPLEELRL